MADSNPVYYYIIPSSSRDLTKREAVQGKYNQTLTLTTGTTYFTGSRSNQTALFVASSTKGTGSLKNGGTVLLNSLTAGTVYEMGLANVKVDSGTCFILMR